MTKIRLDDSALFEVLREFKGEWGSPPRRVGALSADEVRRFKAAIGAMDANDLVVFGPAPTTLPLPAPPAALPRLTPHELQGRIGVLQDGIFGPASRTRLRQRLTNTTARRLTVEDMAELASAWSLPVAHIAGVRKVEAPRGAFDGTGMPTHLYERHVANRNTLPPGRFAASHPDLFNSRGYGPGGYGAYSRQFDRLADACVLDPEAAFRACSWGAFQVLGENAVALGYPSAFDMALALTVDEAAHLDSFRRFVERNDLLSRFRACRPGDPKSCEPFVSAYNGPGHATFGYAPKLAEAIKPR